MLGITIPMEFMNLQMGENPLLKPVLIQQIWV